MQPDISGWGEQLFVCRVIIAVGIGIGGATGGRPLSHLPSLLPARPHRCPSTTTATAVLFCGRTNWSVGADLAPRRRRHCQEKTTHFHGRGGSVGRARARLAAASRMK